MKQSNPGNDCHHHDGGVVMPSDGPPFAPFQRWAFLSTRYGVYGMAIAVHLFCRNAAATAALDPGKPL
jgi:hypothetical protein